MISKIKKNTESTSLIVALKGIGTGLAEAHKELQHLGTNVSEPNEAVLQKRNARQLNRLVLLATFSLRRPEASRECTSHVTFSLRRPAD